MSRDLQERGPRLADIQCRFFALVTRRLGDDYRLAPLPESGEVSRQVLDELVKPNDRLSAEERLELYARQYWFRLIDSFYEDFPGVAALLGDDAFHQFTLDYLEAHPSRGYTLRLLGRKVPEFVTEAKAVPDSLRPAVIDMARLEWAKMEVFDAAEKPALDPETTLSADILSLPIGLQPHLRLLKLDHPVDDWLTRLDREEWRAEASNAVAADSPKHTGGGGEDKEKAEAITPPRRKAVRVVVHRFEEEAWFKRLEPEAFRLLEAFGRGEPLGVALDRLIPESGKPPAWWQSHLKTWFSEWTALRWLTSPG